MLAIFYTKLSINAFNNDGLNIFAVGVDISILTTSQILTNE